MKIFVGGEPLREQLRTAHGPILIDNQTAIGFVAKEGLRNSKDDKRVKSAANDCQDQGGEDGAANFREECFHKLNEMERSNDEIDELDADERHDDAAEAIDEKVALENCKGAHRFVGDTAKR
jgi:hypothetical protein